MTSSAATLKRQDHTNRTCIAVGVVLADAVFKVSAVLAVRKVHLQGDQPTSDNDRNAFVGNFGFQSSDAKNTLHIGDSPCPLPDRIRRAIACTVNEVVWLIKHLFVRAFMATYRPESAAA